MEYSTRYVDGKKEKEFYEKVYHDNQLRREISLLINRLITPKQRDKIREGEFRYFAMAGKKIVKHLSIRHKRSSSRTGQILRMIRYCFLMKCGNWINDGHLNSKWMEAIYLELQNVLNKLKNFLMRYK